MPKIKNAEITEDTKEQLDLDELKLRRYVNIYSMIEQYKNGNYSPYNTSINTDLDDWKYQEPIENTTVNDHGMVEFKIDLSDAVFKGSEESYDKVVSTYQMRLNLSNFEADAYQACLDDTYKSEMVPKNTRCSRTVKNKDEAYKIMKQWSKTTEDKKLKK